MVNGAQNSFSCMAETVLKTKGWAGAAVFLDAVKYPWLYVSGMAHRPARIQWHATGKESWSVTSNFPSPNGSLIDFLIWQLLYFPVRKISNDAMSVFFRPGHAYISGVSRFGTSKFFLELGIPFSILSPKLRLKRTRGNWVACVMSGTNNERSLHICRRDEVNDLPRGERIDIYGQQRQPQYGGLSLPFLKKVRHEIAGY